MLDLALSLATLDDPICPDTPWDEWSTSLPTLDARHPGEEEFEEEEIEGDEEEEIDDFEDEEEDIDDDFDEEEERTNLTMKSMKKSKTSTLMRRRTRSSTTMMNSMNWRMTKKRSTEFTQNSISIALSSLTG